MCSRTPAGTAYTPYQAEISQGRLEALLNFQQMVIDLTGLAGRECVAARRGDRRGGSHGDDPPQREQGDEFFVDAAVHPQVLAVMRTRAKWLGIELVVGDASAICSTKRSLVVTCNIPIRTAAFAISPSGCRKSTLLKAWCRWARTCSR